MNNKKIIKLLKTKYSGNTKNFNFLDFVHAYGSSFDALFYCRLLWPEFIEIEDMIFLKETIEDDTDLKRLKKTLKKYENNKIKTEKEFNLIEIPYIFGKNSAELSDEEDFLLSKYFQQIWQARLIFLYPEKNIIVELLEDLDEVPSITFYQNKIKT